MVLVAVVTGRGTQVRRVSADCLNSSGTDESMLLLNNHRLAANHSKRDKELRLSKKNH